MDSLVSVSGSVRLRGDRSHRTHLEDQRRPVPCQNVRPPHDIGNAVSVQQFGDGCNEIHVELLAVEFEVAHLEYVRSVSPRVQGEMSSRRGLNAHLYVVSHWLCSTVVSIHGRKKATDKHPRSSDP
jgi:hypothetical protein